MTAQEAEARLTHTLVVLTDMVSEALERATGKPVAYQLVCQFGGRTLMVGNLTDDGVARLLTDAGQKVGAGVAETIDMRAQG